MSNREQTTRVLRWCSFAPGRGARGHLISSSPSHVPRPASRKPIIANSFSCRANYKRGAGLTAPCLLSNRASWAKLPAIRSAAVRETLPSSPIPSSPCRYMSTLSLCCSILIYFLLPARRKGLFSARSLADGTPHLCASATARPQQDSSPFLRHPTA